jgi:uncharacterized membrane protein YhaH (DUF805 family)
MGDSVSLRAVSFRDRVLEQGPVDVLARPDVAWVRFWTQGWRFHGRASRTEFLWAIALQAVVVLGAWQLAPHLGLTARWTVYADPFGVVLSPQVAFHLLSIHRGAPDSAWWGFGDGRDAWPDSWDVAIIVVLALTAVPRWSMLVRRLHDRDHTGLWILLMVFFGPFGAVVVGAMALRSSRSSGSRFDRGLFAGRRESPIEPVPSEQLAPQR